MSRCKIGPRAVVENPAGTPYPVIPADHMAGADEPAALINAGEGKAARREGEVDARVVVVQQGIGVDADEIIVGVCDRPYAEREVAGDPDGADRTAVVSTRRRSFFDLVNTAAIIDDLRSAVVGNRITSRSEGAATRRP